eukprot:3003755-Alexandrium_andersonii.AAC.1
MLFVRPPRTIALGCLALALVIMCRRPRVAAWGTEGAGQKKASLGPLGLLNLPSTAPTSADH